MSRRKKKPAPPTAAVAANDNAQITEESSPMNVAKNINAIDLEPSETYVVGAPPRPKKTLTVLNGGANRGARGNLDAFSSFNAASSQLTIVPRYADPLPGRALAMQEEAARQGLVAEAVEARVEDVANDNGTATEPIILNLDRPSAVAKVLNQTANLPRTVMFYILLKLGSGKLWAIRSVIGPDDVDARRKAIAFCEQLANVSERSGSEAIFGGGSDPAHLLAEPVIRAWFADHTEANLAKIAAGIEPTSAPLEVTPNGRDTLTLHLVVKETWSEPSALADEVLKSPTSPIRRGTEFVVAEVTPEGVRFHRVRRRLDNRITVSGATVFDRAAIEAIKDEEQRAVLLAREEEERRAATAAIERAARETLTRLNPIFTTD